MKQTQIQPQIMKQTKKGFTLIELLVVIVIIGILAAGAAAIFTTAQQKARDGIRISDLGSLKTSMEQYSTDFNTYPSNDATGAGAIKKFSQTDPNTLEYIEDIPADPKTGGADAAQEYYYATEGTANTQYEISAKFEAAANDTKATGDKGGDTTRYETGSGNLTTIVTYTTDSSLTTGNTINIIKINGYTSMAAATLTTP